MFQVFAVLVLAGAVLAQSTTDLDAVQPAAGENGDNQTEPIGNNAPYYVMLPNAQPYVPASSYPQYGAPVQYVPSAGTYPAYQSFIQQAQSMLNSQLPPIFHRPPYSFIQQAQSMMNSQLPSIFHRPQHSFIQQAQPMMSSQYPLIFHRPMRPDYSPSPSYSKFGSDPSIQSFAPVSVMPQYVSPHVQPVNPLSSSQIYAVQYPTGLPSQPNYYAHDPLDNKSVYWNGIGSPYGRPPVFG